MTSSSLRSTGGSRICPSCNTGYILPDYLHARCESCLGPEHAGLAVTLLSTRPYCARLILEEKQRRVYAFVTLLEDDCANDDDGGWAKRSRFTIDEALDILDLPCSEGERGARGQESPDSAPSIAGSPPGSHWKTWSLKWPQWIMVWMTMLQRNVWLHMSQFPERVRKGLLDGPTSPDGLFGPLLQEAVSHLQRASEEAERVQRLTSWGPASTGPLHPQSSWQERGDRRPAPKHPPASAASASRSTIPTASIEEETTSG
ncbi:hypothetical protein Q5P01_005421 [Channa striata]|uniref:Uncharacterized protein n=1 Tax=Channa striata TaxID=64152 RepID=A0AA88NG96_CHASR|nr:hypothetical protein Q5P01_005421 [Channa striata]